MPLRQNPSMSHRFPWRLFLQFVLKQTLVMVVVFVIFAAGATWYFRQQSANVLLVEDALPIFTKILVLLLIVLITSFLALSFWMGRSVLLPLDGLIQRARARGGRGREGDLSDSAEPGTFSDISRAIDDLEKDLEGTQERMSYGRAEVEALMTSISEAVLAIDRDGKALFYNSQLFLVFDRPDLSKKPFSISEMFRTLEVLNAYDRAIQENSAQTVPVTIIISNQELSRTFSLSVSPLRDPQSLEPYAAVGIFHDVTELKRAEQIRIDFVANVSHELRTPLTSIKGYADVLKEDLKSGQMGAVEQYLEVISKNVARLMDLVNDLLEISSLEAGMDLDITSVNPEDLSLRAIEQLQNKAKERGQTLSVEILTGQIHVDTKRVEQVLVNLVENAIKYCPRGSTIRVVWLETDTALELRVIDNGPGIGPEHRDRLFERFYRVDQHRSSETGGTGLGLAIVKHILQRHGGKVRVESELGKGTSFICEFPRSSTAGLTSST